MRKVKLVWLSREKSLFHVSTAHSFINRVHYVPGFPAMLTPIIKGMYYRGNDEELLKYLYAKNDRSLLFSIQCGIVTRLQKMCLYWFIQSYIFVVSFNSTVTLVTDVSLFRTFCC